MRNELLGLRNLLLEHVGAHAEGLVVITLLDRANWVGNVVLVDLLSAVDLIGYCVQAAKHDLGSQLLVV